MGKRYLSIWFRHLKTDWFMLRRPALKMIPFALTMSDHGRMLITASNLVAQVQGIHSGIAVADARILVPDIEILDDRPALGGKLLKALALWCVRYTPITTTDLPDGLILDISGCAHLWGGERVYFAEIINRLRSSGYDVRGAIADTIGAAWAVARYGRTTSLIESGDQHKALLSLPPIALRLEQPALDLLKKLGLYRIGDIAGMPRSALRRRFGKELLLRIDQAFGQEPEMIEPILPVEPYQERLPCLEPICHAGGIEIALTRLLEMLCHRLQKEGKGIRTAIFSCYRVDGNIEQISIGTNRGTHHVLHLFKLFAEKISTIEPDLGIELFVLDAPKVEDVSPLQEVLWGGPCGLDDIGLSELLDRVTNKVGAGVIRRYLPAEHYWPERSIRPANSLLENPPNAWPTDRARPIHLLSKPEPIEVAAPIPDYPPMHFRYKGKFHKITKADGPERIEQEWWIEGARHRDYYAVEDEEGARYWLFRSGHYSGINTSQWFIHGFFA
jgi:protein ImuB